MFDWYHKDFEQGRQGFSPHAPTFVEYAALLANAPQAQARIRCGDCRLVFLGYDWRLNGVR